MPRQGTDHANSLSPSPSLAKSVKTLSSRSLAERAPSLVLVLQVLSFHGTHLVQLVRLIVQTGGSHRYAVGRSVRQAGMQAGRRIHGSSSSIFHFFRAAPHHTAPTCLPLWLSPQRPSMSRPAGAALAPPAPLYPGWNNAMPCHAVPRHAIVSSAGDRHFRGGVEGGPLGVYGWG